jgi:transcription elongation factor GreA
MPKLQMQKQYRLTKEGVAELENELNELVGQRGDIAEKLKVAREHGDLRENAEYHNARDEQAKLEARISEIENILRNVEIAKPKNGDAVELGDTVVLKGQKGEQIYTIVGSVEANPLENKISDQSPIGEALMGKSVGDEVVISLPAGEMSYKIKTIK